MDALKDLDEGLRTQLGGKECIDVQEESTLSNIGLAIADVTAGWPFAKITIGIQQICSRYEGLLKLHYAEFHLRKHPMPYSKMKEYQYMTFVLLFQFIAKRIVDFLQPGKKAMVGWSIFNEQFRLGISLLVAFYGLLRTGELLALQGWEFEVSGRSDPVIVSLGLTKSEKRQGVP